MGYSEYESLLLHFFIGPPSSWPNDDLNMFALCVRDWLRELEENTSYIPPGNLYQIFVKMREAIEYLLAGKDFEVFGDWCRSTSSNWLFHLQFCTSKILSRCSDQASTTAFNDLLHVVVQAHRHLDFMESSGFGSTSTHNDLRKTHASPCGDSACPWNNHDYDHSETCPLLEKVPATRNQADVQLSIPTHATGELEDPQSQLTVLRRILGLIISSLRQLGRAAGAVPPDETGRTQMDALELAERGSPRRLSTSVPRGERIKLTQLVGLLRLAWGPITRFENPRLKPEDFPLGAETPERTPPEESTTLCAAQLKVLVELPFALTLLPVERSAVEAPDGGLANDGPVQYDDNDIPVLFGVQGKLRPRHRFTEIHILMLNLQTMHIQVPRAR